VDADESGNQGARRGARDDAREEALEMQRLDHAQMAETKDRSALQHEGGAPEGLARVVQELELGLRGESAMVDGGGLQLGDVLDGEGHLRDVVVYEELGAGVRMQEEPRRRDVSQIAHEAGAQEIAERQDIVVLAGAQECLYPSQDKPIVVVTTGRVLTPSSVSLGTINDSPTLTIDRC
jgi:hypothetical protein